MDSGALLFWTSTVLAVVLAILTRHWRADLGAGLVFAYVATFAVLHWLAPALYLLPWYDTATRDATILGLRESGIAIICFAIGSEIVIRMRRSEIGPLLARPARVVDDRLINLFLLAGAFFYLVVFPIASRLPSVTAIAATGSALIVAGIGLKCWNAWTSGRYAHLWTWLALTVAMPIVTVVVQGFLGSGFGALLTVLAFCGSFYRPRWRVLVAGSLLAYLGLSVYVTYRRDRNDIRNVVWSGAGFGARMDQLETTLANSEWFDLAKIEHLQRIDTRLNQDFMLGAAVSYLESGAVEYGRGETLVQAAAAIIPRALWPDKPVVAGSGELVSTYTGIRFVEGTSVGIGQIMEAYVNFGRLGVIVVFLCIGGLLTWADISAKARLVAGDGAGFVTWYLGGLGMLQLGGAFSEVTSTAAASILVALALGYLSRRLFPDRRNARRATAVPADVPESISR